MSSSRRALAPTAPSFGRRARLFIGPEAPRARTTLGEDARLFAMTFACGFLFMTVYLA